MAKSFQIFMSWKDKYEFQKKYSLSLYPWDEKRRVYWGRLHDGGVLSSIDLHFVRGTQIRLLDMNTREYHTGILIKNLKESGEIVAMMPSGKGNYAFEQLSRNYRRNNQGFKVIPLEENRFQTSLFEKALATFHSNRWQDCFKNSPKRFITVSQYCFINGICPD